MNDLLTTRQLQEMLKVDRITIYRMLEDGRLKGFKVGGQWRFSRSDIEAWIQNQRHDERPVREIPEQNEPPASSYPLSLTCVQAIQGIVAEACDVAAITVSGHGAPLTEINRSCEFCQLILSSAEGKRRCLESWESFQNPDESAALLECHAGLQYIGSPVEVEGQVAAVLLAGQISTRPFPTGEQKHYLEELAKACDLDLVQLNEKANQLTICDAEQIERITRVTRHTAITLSELAQERSFFLKRLQQIAEMTVLD